jgi:hypothetical protein
VGVDLEPVGFQDVPGLAAHKTRSTFGTGVGQAVAEPGHQALDAGVGIRQRPCPPQFVDDGVEGDDPVEVEDEHGQQRPLLRAADRDHPAV